MQVYYAETWEHITNLSCIFDKFADKLTKEEKASLNASMYLMDALERNKGVLILKKI